MTSKELRDEVSAQERDRVRQDAHGERHRNRDVGARQPKAQIDEASHPENVQHCQRSEEQPRQDEKHQLAPLLDHGLIELGEPIECVLFRWKKLGAAFAHEPAF